MLLHCCNPKDSLRSTASLRLLSLTCSLCNPSFSTNNPHFFNFSSPASLPVSSNSSAQHSQASAHTLHRSLDCTTYISTLLLYLRCGMSYRGLVHRCYPIPSCCGPTDSIGSGWALAVVRIYLILRLEDLAVGGMHWACCGR